ncbi:hypothetical protein NP493_91g00005 [Ridgeia piscesae]|uniref:Uncharacterized protein n=1 Tax=Ridgeia piscesae TaxID=27915 RepID=A0AAD9UHZ1_RIDPI|nr:hypothetical protein NP493_91g00005 [Ridgeia piscesae]
MWRSLRRASAFWWRHLLTIELNSIRRASFLRSSYGMKHCVELPITSQHCDLFGACQRRQHFNLVLNACDVDGCPWEGRVAGRSDVHTGQTDHHERLQGQHDTAEVTATQGASQP